MYSKTSEFCTPLVQETLCNIGGVQITGVEENIGRRPKFSLRGQNGDETASPDTKLDLISIYPLYHRIHIDELL